MKKLVCEMCGSTDLVKDNGVFTCQSCGCKYSVDEAKKMMADDTVQIEGTVKVDHTEEIENLTKRINQFIENGDNDKALEYSQKILDLDANNEFAKKIIEYRTNEAVRNISKTNFNIELLQYDVAEHTLSETEIIKTFFKSLKNAKNIACDIYKEITIKSLWGEYIPFYLFSDTYEAKWSAISCYRRYENQTVYRNVQKTYGNQTVWEKEPRTERKEIIDRVPNHGTETFTAIGFTYASNKLYDTVKEFYGKEDKTISEMIKAFEKQLAVKLNQFSFKKLDADDKDFQTIKIDKIPDDNDLDNYIECSSPLSKYIKEHLCPLSKYIEENDYYYPELSKHHLLYFYQDTPINFETDKTFYENKRKTAKNNSEENMILDIKRKIGGDFHENFVIESKLSSSKKLVELIPVQIIEYEYKGKTYIAILDLGTKNTSITTQFPCDTELTETKNSIKSEKKEAAKLPAIFWIGAFVEILGIIFAMSVPAIGVVIVLIALALVIDGLCIRNKRNKNLEKETGSLIENLSRPRLSALSESYEAFSNISKNFSVDEYVDKIKEANNAASKRSIQIDNVHTAVFSEQISVDVMRDNINNSEEDVIIKNLKKEIIHRKKLRNLGFFLISCLLLIPLSTFPLSWIFGEDILNN